eukprot:scaffold518_cov388-Prasinococcus_capsulatus_cf.AAC.60
MRTLLRSQHVTRGPSGREGWPGWQRCSGQRCEWTAKRTRAKSFRCHGRARQQAVPARPSTAQPVLGAAAAQRATCSVQPWRCHAAGATQPARALGAGQRGAPPP